MDNIKLYLGDCLEKIKNIDDHSIDMILCDPHMVLQEINGTLLFHWIKCGMNIKE